MSGEGVGVVGLDELGALVADVPLVVVRLDRAGRDGCDLDEVR